MEKYQVTLEQYARRIKARDNWPDILSMGVYNTKKSAGCVVFYLGVESGLKREEIAHDSGKLISQEGREKISQAYGLPVKELERLENINTRYFLGARRRARKMLCVFNKLLENVEVVLPTQDHGSGDFSSSSLDEQVISEEQKVLVEV